MTKRLRRKIDIYRQTAENGRKFMVYQYSTERFGTCKAAKARYLQLYTRVPADEVRAHFATK